MNLIDENIEAYCWCHTTPEPELLQELINETRETMDMPQMLTGRIEGRFLKMLVALTGAETVVELGTFTGYSALSMAEGLSEKGRIYTCEIDEKALEFSSRYFARSAEGKKIIQIKEPAAAFLNGFDKRVDLAFIDADKEGYPEYYRLLFPLMKPGGLMIFDNMLWSGRVLEPDDSAAEALAALNKIIVNDSRVECTLLSVRDGLNVVRKRL